VGRHEECKRVSRQQVTGEPCGHPDCTPTSCWEIAPQKNYGAAWRPLLAMLEWHAVGESRRALRWARYYYLWLFFVILLTPFLLIYGILASICIAIWGKAR
jgi:hypothetical protein